MKPPIDVYHLGKYSRQLQGDLIAVDVVRGKILEIVDP